MLREVSSHHEIHLVKFQSSASKQQKARLPFFESAQLVDFFGVGTSVAELGVFNPQVSAATNIPPLGPKIHQNPLAIHSFVDSFQNVIDASRRDGKSGLVRKR